MGHPVRLLKNMLLLEKALKFDFGLALENKILYISKKS
jgi:hypothetical protein